MKLFRFLQVALTFAVFVHVTTARQPSPTSPKTLPCSLKWETVSGSVPANVVPVSTSSVVARATVNAVLIAGTYDLVRDEAYFATSDGAVVTLTSFEILTNPHECHLDWVHASGGGAGPHSVVLENGAHIGRATVAEYADRWYAGEVSAGGLTIGVQDRVYHYASYATLASYSSGIIFELDEFVFDQDLNDGKNDFMGLDIIRNESPATINQTVTHRKKVTDIYTVKTTKSWTSKRTTTTKVKIAFVSITKTTTKFWTEEEVEEFTTEETREVGVSRLVSVPPWTSVQVCSTVSVRENVELGYTARGKYSATGLGSEEIVAVLAEEGIHVEVVDGEVVVFGVTGAITASIAVSTELFVSPLAGKQGCGDAK